MYPDPKRVRDNKITVRLDDYEHALVLAMANYQGDAPSTYVRDLVMREAQQVMLLAHEASFSQRAA